MKPTALFFLFIAFFLFSCSQYQEPEKGLNPSLVLWYGQSAESWTEALPVGNGRLGAMLDGDHASLLLKNLVVPSINPETGNDKRRNLFIHFRTINFVNETSLEKS